MAYLQLQNPEEDPAKRQQEAPTLGNAGGVLGGGGNTNGGGSDAPSKPGGTSSGQFVNLQNFLNANSSEGRVGNINKAASGALGEEQGAYNKAADPLRQASYTAPKVNSDYVRSRLDADAYATSHGGKANGELASWVNASYGGPDKVGYQMQDKNRATFKNLGDTNTIADVTAKDAIAAGNYSIGNRNLDTALYGLDPNVRAAQSQIGKDVGDFNQKTGQETAQLEAKTQGFKDAAQKTRDTTRKALTDYQSEMQGALKSRADKANADERARREKYATDYSDWYNHTGQYAPDTAAGTYNQKRDPKTVGRTNPNDKFYESYSGGDTPATAEGLETADEASRFNMIGSLIGGDTSAKAGNWTGGSISYGTPTYGNTAPATNQTGRDIRTAQFNQEQALANNPQLTPEQIRKQMGLA